MSKSKQQAQNSLLIKAVREGDIEETKFLLRMKRANVNAREGRDITPLLEAVNSGNIAMTDLLIDSGANVNSQDIYGAGALLPAVKKNDTTMVALLKKRGADINANYHHSGTPLEVAIRMGHAEVTDLLLNYGANFDLRNDAINQGLSSTLNTSFFKTPSSNYPKIYTLLNNHNDRLNEIADYIYKVEIKHERSPLKKEEKAKFVIDATNFNKDNIISALELKLAAEERAGAREAVENSIDKYKAERLDNRTTKDAKNNARIVVGGKVLPTDIGALVGSWLDNKNLKIVREVLATNKRAGIAAANATSSPPSTITNVDSSISLSDDRKPSGDSPKGNGKSGRTGPG